MNKFALAFEDVSKKFKKGEKFDSLRDMIPAVVKSLFSKDQREELKTREFWALRDVSFQVKRGEAVGIIGHNGSGKSTTLKLLSGILKPTKGQVKVDGRLSALIEIAAGFHQDLTGRENIYLNATILGMRKAEIDRKFDEIVDFSGLEDFIDTPVKRYSSGMYARLGFSVAAHVDPDILLVDEVLSVGDMSFQQRCMEKMQEKIRSDVAVVFVSHNLASVANLCNRAILLNRGNIVVDGPCDEAIQAYVKAMSNGSRFEGADEKIRIVEATFKAAGDQTAYIIQPHTRCQLLVTFECQSAVPAFQVGFIIRRTQDMSFCYATTTQDLGQPLYAVNPGERLTVRFEFDAHLARGHYRIDLSLRNPIRPGFLLQSDGVANFTVTEQVTSRGLVDIGLRATIESIVANEPAPMAVHAR